VSKRKQKGTARLQEFQQAKRLDKLTVPTASNPLSRAMR